MKYWLSLKSLNDASLFGPRQCTSIFELLSGMKLYIIPSVGLIYFYQACAMCHDQDVLMFMTFTFASCIGYIL